MERSTGSGGILDNGQIRFFLKFECRLTSCANFLRYRTHHEYELEACQTQNASEYSSHTIFCQNSSAVSSTIQLTKYYLKETEKLSRTCEQVVFQFCGLNGTIVFLYGFIYCFFTDLLLFVGGSEIEKETFSINNPWPDCFYC